MAKITITIEGLGGELNVGRISKNAYKSLKEITANNYKEFFKNDEQMASIGLAPYSQINDVLGLKAVTLAGCNICIIDEKNSVIFSGEYNNLETDYCGDFNEEHIIAVSENSEEHEFATEIIDQPILYTYSIEKGLFFKADITLSEGEVFDLNEVALCISEVKINTDDDTLFSQDFIFEVRYKEELLSNQHTDSTPLGMDANIVAP